MTSLQLANCSMFVKQVRRYVAVWITATESLPVYTGFPRSTFAPIQRVQNVAAQLLLSLKPFDHTIPATTSTALAAGFYPVQYKL